MGIALTIAGSDSGGGAGIQADLKAFSALKVYGCSVITAVTAQNTRTVSAVHPIPPAMITAQIEAVLSDIKVDVLKIGMLGGPEIIEAVAKALADFAGPIVLDPVMIAKSGTALLPSEAVAALKALLLPRATLLTPNIAEAAVLLGTEVKLSDAALIAQGHALLALGPQAVLMKGGHGIEPVCTDWFISEQEQSAFKAKRVATRNTHGTGCSYSSAIAAELAKGQKLVAAVGAAHSWLHQAITHADALNIAFTPDGHGPVHHFHTIWN